MTEKDNTSDERDGYFIFFFFLLLLLAQVGAQESSRLCDHLLHGRLHLRDRGQGTQQHTLVDKDWPFSDNFPLSVVSW